MLFFRPKLVEEVLDFWVGFCFIKKLIYFFIYLSI